MGFSETRASIFVVSAVALALTSQAAIAGDGWQIVDTAGDVTAGGTGYIPASLNKHETLPADAWVETKANGRAVLVRGSESIVVGPNSRVQLPNEEVNGNTQVLQTMGSALYQIGKQQKPHFQVDTPYLAAVVKGTQFTVTVNGDSASVTVTEGRVEVATPDQSDVEFVMPGFTAIVSHDHAGSVVVEKTNDSAAPAVNVDTSEKTASRERSGSEGAEPTDKLSGAGSVEIPTAIGEVDLNVKEVSGGLAFGEVNAVTAESVSENGGSSKVKEEKDVSGASEGQGSDSVVASNDEGSEGRGQSENGGSNPGGEIDAPDLGSGGGVSAIPGNGQGNGSGNGAGSNPVFGDVEDAAPDLGGGTGNANAGGNGNGNAGGNGNGNAGGNGNGNGSH